MFGEELTENFDFAGSFHNSTPIHLPNFPRNNRWSFPQSPKLSKACLMPIWFQINRSRVRIPFWHITAVKIKCFFFLLLSWHFISLHSRQRQTLCYKAVQPCPELAITFFSCFRLKVLWRHVTWQKSTLACACLLVTARRNLDCTPVYLLHKATYVGLKDWVLSSSILTANVWNSPPVYKQIQVVIHFS